jgi:hypothetical protein
MGERASRKSANETSKKNKKALLLSVRRRRGLLLF